MTLSIFSIIAIAGIAPLAVLIIVARIQVYRRRAAAKIAKELAASKRAAGEPENLPESRFEAKAEPTPGFMLRRFTHPQRVYLREQFAPARFGFFFCAYVLTVVISLGLLPQQVRQVGISNLSAQVWLSFMSQLNMAYFVALLLAIFTAILVITNLQTPTVAIFIRTRPLSHSFLFWARTATALAALIASILTAILASTTLLLLTYWAQIPSASGLVQPILAPSLSILITAVLVFSIFTLGAFIPGRFHTLGKKGKFSVPALGAIASITAINIERAIHAAPTARLFFLLPTHAATSIYVLALVPIACSVAFLAVAQRLSARFEV